MTSKNARPGKKAFHLKGTIPAPLGAYSHAVQAGDLLFISGQGARDAKTGKTAGVTLDNQGKVKAYDIEAQTRAVLENLTAVLKACGSTFTDLVKVTVYLTDMADFEKYNRVYSQYFSFADPPARTTVQVAGLPGANFIEIEAIAIRKE